MRRIRMPEEKQKEVKEVTEDNYINYNSLAKDEPEKYVKLKLGFLRKMIPKKNAALEVWKEAQLNFILGIGAILGVMITATFGALHKYAGAASAGIIAIVAAFYVKNARTRIKDLEAEYQIKPSAK